jgi:hypothetical protein
MGSRVVLRYVKLILEPHKIDWYITSYDSWIYYIFILVVLLRRAHENTHRHLEEPSSGTFCGRPFENVDRSYEDMLRSRSICNLRVRVVGWTTCV